MGLPPYQRRRATLFPIPLKNLKVKIKCMKQLVALKTIRDASSNWGFAD
jgi:hypothetical protein